MTNRSEIQEDAMCSICCEQLKGMELGEMDDKLEVLKYPEKVLKSNLKVKMDDGETRIFPAFRIQYNSSRGPSKGGIRFHPAVSEEEVEELAFLMALKCSLIDIPYGGGKGGVKVDVSQLSKSEKEKLSREYIKSFHRFIGPEKDIPAPDMNTDQQVMGWMVDEYEKVEGSKQPGVITGKPVPLGGSLGRVYATSLGGSIVLENYLEEEGVGNVDVAIQGFGNVGSNLARILDENGHTVVAVSDADGGIIDREGIDIPNLLEVYDKDGDLEKYDAETISNKELLELDVDVLVPAAIENQITSDNVEDVSAGIILEMANGPVTPEADRVLDEGGIPVIPDILANAGGVTVSYFEWLQNISNEYWTEEKVNQKLEKYMTSAFEKVMEVRKGKDVSLRQSAYRIGVKRVFEAEDARGNLG